MKIAYILNTYPQPSQSFIRREIRSLERQGHDVLRFAMRSAQVRLVDAQDQAEAAKTEYVLPEGAGILARATWGAVRRDLAGFAAAFKAAWHMGAVSEAGRSKVFIHGSRTRRI